MLENVKQFFIRLGKLNFFMSLMSGTVSLSPTRDIGLACACEISDHRSCYSVCAIVKLCCAFFVCVSLVFEHHVRPNYRLIFR